MINITREFIEKMYTYKCDIIVKEKVVNDNFETTFKDKELYKNVKCKLSYNSVLSAEKSVNKTLVFSNVKLFINPDIEIPSGSRIRLKQNGKVEYYNYTGEVALFFTHQELSLELEKQYA